MAEHLLGLPIKHKFKDIKNRDHGLLTNVLENQHHAKLHQLLHQAGGSDELSIDTLAGIITASQHGTKTVIPDAHHDKAHEASHRDGGLDAIAGALALVAIPDLPASKITSGILAATRGGLSKALSPTWTDNYILVYKVATDNFVMEIKPAGGAGGYDTIQEEGVDLTQRTKLNFVSPVLTAEDDAVNLVTKAILNAGVPVDVGTANAEGSAVAVARRDHIHKHPSGLGVDLHHRKWSWADEQGWRKEFLLPFAHSNKWTKYTGNPVFEKSNVSGKFDENGVNAPCIIKVGQYYYLFYLGISASQGFAGIGVARSTSPYGPFTRLNNGDPILAPPTNRGYASPSVIYDEYETDANKRWKIWFADLVMATGVGTKKYSYSANPDSGWATPVDSTLPNPTSSWRWAVTVMRFGNLFYALCCNNNAQSLCYTTFSPLETWTSRGVAVDKGSAGAWDDAQISFFSITYILGVFYVFYSGQRSSDFKWQSGMALSTDLRMVESPSGFKKWVENPILGFGGVGDPDEKRAHNPNFIQVDEKMYLYYHSIDGSDVSAISVATIP